jgi:HK97 family phage major capsid protein/HK97 family phage prohead protease
VSNRAYSLLELKSVDDDLRTIEGIATNVQPDRLGDIVEPKGASFKLPLPLLWQHRRDEPIGHVIAARVTDDGIHIKAQIAKGVLPRIDEAWALIKAGLVKGLSIGFKPHDAEQISGSFGMRFKTWEWLELSAVTVPAHAEASITLVKSIDAKDLAETGETSRLHTPGDTGTRAVHYGTKAPVMTKTYAEQIRDLEGTIAAKASEREQIHTKAVDEGRSKDGDERDKFDALGKEIESLTQELADARELEKLNIQKAAPAAGSTPAAASATRQGIGHISIKETLPPGIGFARAVKARVVSRLDSRNIHEVAKEMYPSDDRLHAHLKAAVPAGTTTQTVWAAPLVDPTNLAGEFIEYLRPATIIGKLNLRRVPFNVRMIEQTGGGTGYWVGQGAPKPLTSFAFEAITLAFTKVAAISVITQELARFSTPSAEMLVRDGLRDALVERIDRDFIDPAEAGTANVQPASITNGLTALTSAGTSADNARTDLANIVSTFVEANLNAQGLAIIMPTTLGLALSFQVNSLGQPEFPGLSMEGGTLNGIPVILSQYAANASGGGNLVIALNQREIFLADDGAVTVDASQEASLQMLDNPTNNSATATPTTMVSMWQTNSIALRAERFINWAKRRDDAVVYMDDVNWGSIGSP